MKSPLHILHLEDDPNDAMLIQATLEQGGIKPVIKQVTNQADFSTVLERDGIDLVISDFALPGFDGLTALKLVRERRPDTPFILVSGTLGEEQAVEALKSGATDYVLKERLARLVPAVSRAMEELAIRTERRRLEQQFIEAQKMEVIGHLASGVAHDFNNILGVIIGYSDLMLVESDPGTVFHDYTEEISHAAGRAAALTRQLLVFSRKQAIQTVVLNLNSIICEMEEMLRRLIDENIELHLDLGQETGRIKADSGQIGQVLMNLVVNARDAMPDGGRLTIATSNCQPDKNFPDARPGDFVLLSVSDTGTGIPDDVKAHLFEAFFTTKRAGKGTGLGLATCQAIIKQYGGHIDVGSEPGKGATFRVYLPRVDQEPDIPDDQPQPSPLPRGTETVLLVEDEPSLRHLAQRVLETQGYTVLRATNGREGLNITRTHTGPPIQLVVTDVVMPQMGGKVMAEWLQTIYPDLKILFTSGYTEEAMALEGVLKAGIDFLPKPYSPAALARKVREMLDKTEP